MRCASSGLTVRAMTDLSGGQGSWWRDDARGRHCQNNVKASALDEEVAQLCGTELTPLGEGGGTVQLEIFAAVEMALLIEMIAYG